MNSRILMVISVVLVVLVLASTFVVPETKHAIKLQLGEIKETNYEPGLHFKMPFINNVVNYERRILTVDLPPERFLTSEKKNVIVDSFVKWRIIDPAGYYVATGGQSNETNAQRQAASRLSAIIRDALQSQIRNRTLQETISGERREIMEVVQRKVNEEAERLGIDIADVRIKSVSLPEDVSSSVYERMIKERETVAKDFRSRGRERARGVRADADRQATVIEAEAYRESEILRGSGDAEAANIYASAYGQDPEFYAFHRSLEAYRKSFASGSDVLILDPDSEFFKYFQNMQGR